MNNRLKGKVALVTGASRGIGRAIAERLSRDGAAVVINYASNAGDARKLAGEIEAAGGQALAVQADIARVAEVVRLFDETIARFGKLDILVNNAGLMITKPVSAMTEAEFDQIFAVNVKGTFFTCQQAATRLADGGRIINVSSSTTARMMPNYGAYVATKGAVEVTARIEASSCWLATKTASGVTTTTRSLTPASTTTRSDSSLQTMFPLAPSARCRAGSRWLPCSSAGRYRAHAVQLPTLSHPTAPPGQWPPRQAP